MILQFAHIVGGQDPALYVDDSAQTAKHQHTVMIALHELLS